MFFSVEKKHKINNSLILYINNFKKSLIKMYFETLIVTKLTLKEFNRRTKIKQSLT